MLIAHATRVVLSHLPFRSIKFAYLAFNSFSVYIYAATMGACALAVVAPEPVLSCMSFILVSLLIAHETTSFVQGPASVCVLSVDKQQRILCAHTSVKSTKFDTNSTTCIFVCHFPFIGHRHRCTEAGQYAVPCLSRFPVTLSCASLAAVTNKRCTVDEIEFMRI